MDFLKTAWDKVVIGAVAVGGFLATTLGGWDITLRVLLICMAVDFVTGLIVAALNRSGKTEGGGLDSRAGAKGIAKKVLALLIVVLATAIDSAIGEGAVFRDMVCWFYIANEALSILENTSLAGVPWPPKLKEALEQLKERKSVGGE